MLPRPIGSPSTVAYSTPPPIAHFRPFRGTQSNHGSQGEGDIPPLPHQMPHFPGVQVTDLTHGNDVPLLHQNIAKPEDIEGQQESGLTFFGNPDVTYLFAALSAALGTGAYLLESEALGFACAITSLATLASTDTAKQTTLYVLEKLGIT